LTQKQALKLAVADVLVGDDAAEAWTQYEEKIRPDERAEVKFRKNFEARKARAGQGTVEPRKKKRAKPEPGASDAQRATDEAGQKLLHRLGQQQDGRKKSQFSKTNQPTRGHDETLEQIQIARAAKTAKRTQPKQADASGEAKSREHQHWSACHVWAYVMLHASHNASHRAVTVIANPAQVHGVRQARCCAESPEGGATEGQEAQAQGR
jgi:hypothetical protein